MTADNQPIACTLSGEGSNDRMRSSCVMLAGSPARRSHAAAPGWRGVEPWRSRALRCL